MLGFLTSAAGLGHAAAQRADELTTGF